nr:MAG TPA: Receptor Binding Protein sandwich domain, phage receptor [Caudoviricetes sp.]
MVHLITGYAGTEHITSADDGSFNAAFFGDGQNVMQIGNQFSASIIDNNTVRILDGDGLMYGRHFRIPKNTYEDVTIKTGEAGKNRIDIICVEYSKNANSGIESTEIKVIEGTPATSAVQPTPTNGNILNGATLNQMPLYKVEVEGVVLKKVTKLFTTIPTYKSLAEQAAADFAAKIDEKVANLATKDDVETAKSEVQRAASAAQSTADTAVSKANAAQSTANNAMPKSGGTFTGRVVMSDNSSQAGDWSVKNICIRNSSWNGITSHTQVVFMLRK